MSSTESNEAHGQRDSEADGDVTDDALREVPGGNAKVHDGRDIDGTGSYEVVGIPQAQCHFDNDAGERVCPSNAEWQLHGPDGTFLGVFCYHHALSARVYLNRQLERQNRESVASS